MPLHLDYRPQNFSEIIGNQTTIRTIQSKRDDPPHAVMLHGPSGCGKTTIARIMSSELGCDIKSNDFAELDIAQLTGVDTAREIRQNMHFRPISSKCRVWLLDEFHKASTAFQNAMLKALEDTPDHVFFILVTTEPEKIIRTIQTRCMKLKVEPLNDGQLGSLIKWVLNQEQVEISENVIAEIISVAGGCPREALVILDQIIDQPASEMINAIYQAQAGKEIKDLCQAMLKGASWPDMAEIIKGMKDIDPERTRLAILGYFSAIALDKQGFNKKDRKKWDAVAARSAYIFDCFRESVFYTGVPGIVFAAYNTTLS